MQLTTLVKDVGIKLGMTVTDRDVASIALSCRVAGLTDILSPDLTTIDAVTSACKSFAGRQLATARVGEPAQSLDTCPICEAQMKDVKLVNDRAAKYCEVHRVCLPIKPE